MMKTLENQIFNDIIADIDRPLRICFVCTGNTCRSPMAEAVTNHLCADHVEAISCGLNPYVGMPISANAVTALRNASIPSTDNNKYEDHIAREASLDIFSSCDRIYGMTDRHTMQLITEFPEAASKIFSMPREIKDPWGSDQQTYDRTLTEITDCIRKLFCVE